MDIKALSLSVVCWSAACLATFAIPRSDRPETWFHVIGGNASKAGLTADLEALKSAGFGGIQFFHGQFGKVLEWDGVQEQIPCLSAKWDDLVTHAANECARLGLTFKMQNCPGWSMSGGPWIAPSNAMRKLVFARHDLVGRVVPNAPGGGLRTSRPTDFAAICAKATAQAPSQRYENMDAMLDDLRRFLAHKPVAANPPSLLRRFRLFANRNPLAASGIVAASILLAAFVAALAVGYIRTNRALAATEREAASAAQSLAMVVTTINVENQDKRDAEITRALTAAEHLAERFPNNTAIAEAVEKLKHAREAHKRFKERRGGEMFPRRRFRPVPRR